MAKILLVDDEPSILSVLSTLLKSDGHEVVTALGGQQAIDAMSKDEFDLTISDIRMNPVNGIDVLTHASKNHPNMAVIMLTAFGTVETAVDALKLGAFDYVTKPFKVDELLITVEKALEYRRAITENADLKSMLETRYHLENIIAESPSMIHICEMIQKIGPTDATVLISGESGTGKEIVARAIHAVSRRKDGKFVAVNCAALPEQLLESEMFGHVKGAFTGAVNDKIGLFKEADGGTIFLDEIGAMPLNIQGKLLRVLQEKEIRKVGSNENEHVDTRVLAATNRRIEELMKEGLFREDLYYRLSVIPLDIKPLRERPEDILPLAYHFMKRDTAENGTPPALTPEVCAIFNAYSWPGNIRELENTIKHALTFSQDNKITRESLPQKIALIKPSSASMANNSEAFNGSKCKSLKAFLRNKEKDYLEQVLSHTKGDKEEAAKALKISLATLYRKLPEIQE